MTIISYMTQIFPIYVSFSMSKCGKQYVEHLEDASTENTAFTTTFYKEQVENESSQNKNIFIRQLMVFLVCSLLNICGGGVSGYSAILLPQLEEKNSKIILTTNQQSWIASAAPLTMVLGCVLSGWSMEYFGRKRTLRYSGIIYLIGWAVIYVSKTIECLVVGRTITGFCVGYQGIVGSCFIGEVSSPKYRGIFLAGICLGIATGVLIMHILGTFLAWQTCALIMCFPTILQLLLIIPVHDSHIWLISKGKFREAQAAYEWYTGDIKRLDINTNEVWSSTDIDVNSTSIQLPTNTQRNYKQFLKKGFIKPVMIMNIFFITAQFSGNNVVGFYAVSIMQQTAPTLNKYAAMIIYDAIRAFMSIIACVLTQRYKTRALTFVSAIGTILSLYLLATFAFLSTIYPENSTIATVPFGFLISYIIFISIGIVPLPWSLSGELLPPQNKGLGGGISTAINFLAFFVVVKTSPQLLQDYGTSCTFALYGSITLFCCLILYVILPETKNKTLEEIQSSFK